MKNFEQFKKGFVSEGMMKPVNKFMDKDNNAIAKGVTITLPDGYKYVVQAVRQFEYKGNTRYSVIVKKPKGRKLNAAVYYEGGDWSTPSGWSGKLS